MTERNGENVPHGTWWRDLRPRWHQWRLSRLVAASERRAVRLWRSL